MEKNEFLFVVWILLSAQENWISTSSASLRFKKKKILQDSMQEYFLCSSHLSMKEVTASVPFPDRKMELLKN